MPHTTGQRESACYNPSGTIWRVRCNFENTGATRRQRDGRTGFSSTPDENLIKKLYAARQPYSTVTARSLLGKRLSTVGRRAFRGPPTAPVAVAHV